MWSPGRTVVHQEFWKGLLWAARPMRVVEDVDEHALLWLPFGTRRKVPVTPPNRSDPPDIQARTVENLLHRDWQLADHLWNVSTLTILYPDAWHSTWVSWRADGSHLGWYINLQRPARRTTIGFEAMDLMLDIVVEPDLTWRWKDLDEFEEIMRRGIFDRDTGNQVMAEARRVINDIESQRAPFDQDWPSWSPDPTWRRPTLPTNWQQPPRL